MSIGAARLPPDWKEQAMFGRLFRAHKSGGNAVPLYGAIVAQARTPALYSDAGVPDTVEGRLEMVLLHTILAVRRLGRGTPLGELGQEVFDLFCQDMDRTLREMGVGDLGVPRQMRQIGEAFYGRAAAYEPALAAGDAAALAEAIGRNVFPESEDPRGARIVAAYAIAGAQALAAADDSTFAAGRIAFPDPAAFLPADAAS
jgi:cytochrome b pre-mRNA-processing protein 3